MGQPATLAGTWQPRPAQRRPGRTRLHNDPRRAGRAPGRQHSTHGPESVSPMSWLHPRFRIATRRPRPRALRVDALDARIVPAVTASFAARSSILSILGDAQDNAITISRDAAGRILINGGAITVRGGTPTVANTTLIQVHGQGGNDTIALDEVNG